MTDKFDVGASWKQGNSFAYVSSTDYDWENGTYWHSGRLLNSPSSAPTCDVVWGKDEEEDYDKLVTRCKAQSTNVTRCFIKDKKQCMPCALNGYTAFMSLAIFVVIGFTLLTFYNTILEAAQAGKKGYSTVVKYVEVLLKFIQIIGVGSVSTFFLPFEIGHHVSSRHSNHGVFILLSALAHTDVSKSLISKGILWPIVTNYGSCIC